MSSFSDWVNFFVAASVMVLLFVVMILLIALLAKKGAKSGGKTVLTVRHLNKEIENYKDILLTNILPAPELKSYRKIKKEQEKETQKEQAKKEKQKKAEPETTVATPPKKRVFVIDFKGDVSASEGHHLKDEITAILEVAQGSDEVVVRLESAGGMVHAYGLAASQLLRIRDKNIPLTVCVDKVAASGGYLMAVVAHKILAAPFSFIGSIGVVSSLPNFHRLLEKNNVDYLELTAGEYKRTVSFFGEITESHKAKHQEHLQLIHELFKAHILKFRPSLAMDKVATGEFWPASKALEFDLLDGLATSDEYLAEKIKEAEVYLVAFEEKPSLKNKFFKNFGSSLAKFTGNLPISSENDPTKYIHT